MNGLQAEFQHRVGCGGGGKGAFICRRAIAMKKFLEQVQFSCIPFCF